MKIRFGVGLGADSGPEQLAEIVDHLEAAGVDSLWFSELVYSHLVDPFVGMAFALARTTRLKVGTSVAVLPGRHPVLVAKQLASLCGARAQSGCCRCSACARRCPPNVTCFPCPTGSARPYSTSRCSCCASRCARITSTSQVTSSPSRECRCSRNRIRRWTSGSAGRRPAAFRRIGALGDGWLGSFLTPTEAGQARQAIIAAADERGPRHRTRSLRNQPRGRQR